MKYWFTLVLTLCLTVIASAEHQSADTHMTIGPFSVDPAAAIYVVVGDEPVDVRLVLNRSYRKEGDRVVIRAFDPDENLTFWQFVKAGQVLDAMGPGDSEIYGIPIQIPVKPRPHELLYDATIHLKGKGVHQIRLSAGARNTVATLTFSKACPYGISFQNGWYHRWDLQMQKAYAYVPPHALSLTVIGGPVTVTDEKGKQLLNTPDDTRTRKDAAITEHKKVLTFELPKAQWFKFRASGFPVILCPTPEAARTLKASVIELPDGTVVCHKFQAKIAKLLPELLKPEHVGKAEDLIKPLDQYKDVLLADPLRNEHLLNPWASLRCLPQILRNQNVDPTSHWGGSFGGKGGWQDRVNKPYPENRWDTLGSVKGLYAGTSPRSSDGQSLADAYRIDASVNPYHGRKELLYRAAAASLRDLMTLGEDENWRGVGADNTDYAGMMAFAVAQKTFPVFAEVAPLMPKEVREVWTEGLRHIVDRLYPENMVSCRNQSSHYLVAFEAFAEGSGLPRYKQLARAYAQRFRDEAHPSGYQIEQCGPDGSYIGMTHWHEAVYYQMSKDPVILDDLRKSYDFFNRTVAPEPNGKRILGGFNFNHRVGDGFYFEQWGGAKGILDDVLPEVGTWSRFSPRDPEAIQKARESISKALASGDESVHHSNIETMRYLYYSHKPDQSMLLPAESPKPFINNLNDELINVKQSDYYAVIYVGHPAPSEYYIHKREKYRMPFANDAEDKPTPVNNRNVTPYVGGGMSLFWTPSFGTAIMSTNWSPVYRQGLVAQQQDLKRYWEDYFDNSFELDKNQRTLTIKGKVEKQPLRYVRTYHFDHHAMTMEVALTASKDLTLKNMIEVLPFPTGGFKPDGNTVTAAGKTTGKVTAKQVVMTDNNGSGVQIDFEADQNLRMVPNGMKRYNWQIGRVEVQLPTTWKAGQTYTLRYTLSPVKAKAQ